MLQIVLGIVMAFGIGTFCGWFDIPSPAPPRLVGALLVVAMTVGFLLKDHLLAGFGRSSEQAEQPHPETLW